MDKSMCKCVITQALLVRPTSDNHSIVDSHSHPTPPSYSDNKY